MEKYTQCPKCMSNDIVITKDDSGYWPSVNYDCGKCWYYFWGHC